MASREMFANETSVMKALFQDYSKRDDFEAVAAVDRDVVEVQQLCTQREADVKTVLRGTRPGPTAATVRIHIYRLTRACVYMLQKVLTHMFAAGMCFPGVWCIAELSQLVQELEASSAYPHRAGEHSERVALLQAEINSARRAVEQLTAESR